MHGADFNIPYLRTYESSPSFRQTRKNIKNKLIIVKKRIHFDNETV